jgi:erythromycin esterase-like protein
MTTHAWPTTDYPIDILQPLTGATEDYDALLETIGSRRIVLIGESTHGTHEFYRERSRITRRLIDDLGFTAVAVEADWPDAYRVNRYVRGISGDRDPQSALSDFRRFPSWMWRNTDVVAFIQWLRARNDAQSQQASKVGFYGLDLHSLRASIEAVIAYLDDHDPEAAEGARERYSCFDMVSMEGHEYGRALTTDLRADCEAPVIDQLVELQRLRADLLSGDGWLAEDDFFFAEQNARLILNAEQYYRQMFRGALSSWNIRDTHMAQTLEDLVNHLDRSDGSARVVVWAHNSHVGDARATYLGHRGELSLGQLVRQRWPRDSFLIGLTTDHGRVTAASEWGGPAERKQVRAALPDSYEHVFHQLGHRAFVMPLGPARGIPGNLLQRAIGVIYRPQTERASHWLRADIHNQFDAVIHIDKTTALEPLERTPLWDLSEPPETYPSGL